MTKIAVLTGNGLSVALNLEFSLANITKRFFNRLKPEHKAFVEHHMLDKNNKGDFEECIASIEKYYDALNYPAIQWPVIGGQSRFNFNPGHRVKQKSANPKIRLHHLHGSISSFRHINTGKLFKIRTEALWEYQIYEKILDLKIVPSIVTGGRKSIKVQELPFKFYNDEFKKKMCDEEHLCDKLFIIGYNCRSS